MMQPPAQPRLKIPLTVFVLALLLSGCAPSVQAIPGPITAAADPTLNQQAYETEYNQSYIVRPNDVIRVTVFREPDLSAERLVVSTDGSVSLPLIGSLAVGGSTIEDIEKNAESALTAQFLRHPDVTVGVIEYGSHRVSVEGAVENPGIFSFPPGTRLSGGIALAEGVDRVARHSEIAVFRQGARGMEIAKFDYLAMQAGTMIDPVLQPGDRIVVGTDSLSQFWQDALQALPVFALFTQF
jgi:polysaccharide biosynthesis/export protein